MQELRVVQGRNGYSISWKEYTDDNNQIDYIEFFQESSLRDNEFEPELKNITDEQHCFTKLVYALAEHFSLGYDKFSEDNLKITWDKKGDKL